MTAKEIFDKGQILTLGKAKELTGKYIYVTNREYWTNDPRVRRVLVNPISEWDAASKDHTVEGFKNRQAYWKSFMTKKEIGRMKNCYRIGLNELGNPDGRTFHWTDDTPFYGSDVDRKIYYLEDK